MSYRGARISGVLHHLKASTTAPRINIAILVTANVRKSDDDSAALHGVAEVSPESVSVLSGRPRPHARHARPR